MERRRRWCDNYRNLTYILFQDVMVKSEKIIDQWRNLSIQLGHRAKLAYNGKEFAGNCIGIDPEQGLIIQLDSGGVRIFDAAHTTILK